MSAATTARLAAEELTGEQIWRESCVVCHGEGGRGQDWTKGCVALTNRDMDELMRIVGNGTPVTIIGSDGRGALAALSGDAKPRGLER